MCTSWYSRQPDISCVKGAAVLAAELLDLYMGKLEEQLDRTEDTFRHMSSLLLLLQQFPGDMEPLFQQDVVTFFTNQLPVLNQLRLSTCCCSACLGISPCLAREQLAVMESNAFNEGLEDCTVQHVSSIHLPCQPRSSRPIVELSNDDDMSVHVLKSNP